MRLAQIRFLEQGETPRLPRWAGCLPKRARDAVRVRYCPYRLEEDETGLWGILQTERAEGLSAPWRRHALSLLAALEEAGAGILVPPAEGEFPRERLPFAEGRTMARLFAFDGAAEALRRRGKEPEGCAYLIAGGTAEIWAEVLCGIGTLCNRLSLLTDDPKQADGIARRLYAEQGLALEVFSSPQHPAVAAADAMLCCGMEQRAYEAMLGEGAVWLDLAGNRPSLRRLMRLRADVAAAEGFFFRRGAEETEGRVAEAQAFLESEALRRCLLGRADADAEAALCALRESGFAVSGFSALGRRVKIAKNTGKMRF